MGVPKNSVFTPKLEILPPSQRRGTCHNSALLLRSDFVL